MSATASRQPRPDLAPPDTAVGILQARIIKQADHTLAMHQILLRHIPPVLETTHPEARFAPIEYTHVADAEATVFAFGGMSHGLTMPIREFHGQLRGTACNVVYLKDFHLCWYQKGLLSLTRSRAETLALLADRFGDLPRPWIFVGSSAGGHAALFFGHAMTADRVVAFGPQTYVDQAVFAGNRPKLAHETGFDFDDPENDLHDHLQGTRKIADAVIVYAGRHETDRQHARRLAAIDGVQLMEIDTNQHAVAAVLRAQGQLKATVFGATLSTNGAGA
ncbi:hypothetical protein [Cognatishimia sp. F0-27]|uniref:hypothetical protein n=1 Tax=Cognatishimia sp. F0-27 TaxID=2816855 RepID=UPI001D0C8C8C|nr:hypothetical protein [Cognatishimia sp. F0-27]MCC1491535.1 hypothetical protein [Cognatishimia sp. F0-27]